MRCQIADSECSHEELDTLTWGRFRCDCGIGHMEWIVEDALSALSTYRQPVVRPDRRMCAARRNTASIMAAVNLRVFVFCRLG
jgi:hypothetical protein